MLNNLLIYWLQTILIFILINILIRIYKFFKISYFFSLTVERFLDINGKILIYYLIFKNIKSTSLLNWNSKDNYINILNAVLYIINNDPCFFNQNLCIIFCEVNKNLITPISEPCIINFNEINSANELFDLINWNTLTPFKKNNDEMSNKDIVVIIKIL
jgi:hypothetical protein